MGFGELPSREDTTAARRPAAIAPPATLVMIAADDAIARNLMRATLENGGFSVIEAVDGIAAFALCRQRRPRLLVADAALPGMDGYGLCRALRGDPATAALPILVATNLDDEAAITRAFEAGASNFMMKPINWVVLNHHVRYMLRASDAHAAADAANRLLEGKVVQRTAVVRRLSDALRRSREQPGTGALVTGRLPTRLGHDLHTRLTAIVGLAGMIGSPAVGMTTTERDREYARLIEHNGRHLLALLASRTDPAD